MVRQLILIRHGEPDEAYRGRYVGRTDVSLSARGQRQARALAGPLAGFSRASFRVSPLLRTRETAAIALARGGAEGPDPIGSGGGSPALPGGIVTDGSLREIDFGAWEGKSFAQIAATDPAGVDRWARMDDGFAFPGGEAIADFQRRISATAHAAVSGTAPTEVLITHGGVIRFLLCLLLGIDVRHHLAFDIAPASISELRIDGGLGVLTRLNDRHHLEGL